MTEKARAARAAYKRKWARDNPDKIKAQQARYWAKKAAQMRGEGKPGGQTATETEGKDDK